MEWMTSTAGNGHLNESITRDYEYLFSREQILRFPGATEELEEDGNGGRDVGNAVDIPERRVWLGDVENEGFVGGTTSKFAWFFSSDGLGKSMARLVIWDLRKR